MEPKLENSSYPIFEPNQVLSHDQLNDLFKYLDEQERLTRANLIGIGIVCGLEARLDREPAIVHITKGCGVTSEGYLITVPDDLELKSYRKYELPPEPAYPPFAGVSMLEMFEGEEPGARTFIDKLKEQSDFLDNKAVLLFYELKKEGLQTCSPNSCDDKGSRVSATVRPLLIDKGDLEKIADAAAKDPYTGAEFPDPESFLSNQILQWDLRLPRFDIPHSPSISSGEVLASFHNVFVQDDLPSKIRDALASAYQAFRPLLEPQYSDPSEAFIQKFGFLGRPLTSTDQVPFLQYYYDLFDDILKAYEELCLKGAEMLCACCPPSRLFPRHLALGLLGSAAGTGQSACRQRFIPSPAVAQCGAHKRELVQLFGRLVKMIDCFTDKPLKQSTGIKQAILITPSQLGDVPLSEKAIPYYYLQEGATPLYRLWSPAKSRMNRAHHNLSYRSSEYKDPAAPRFVTVPLQFNLEEYNFLRIEGHLGMHYEEAVRIISRFKKRYRLPIEVKALSTGDRLGAFQEKNPGIQHKAGTPIGGTFIIVYHSPPKPPESEPNAYPGKAVKKLSGHAASSGLAARDAPVASSTAADLEASPVSDALRAAGEEVEKLVSHIQSRPELMADPKIGELISTLGGRFGGFIGKNPTSIEVDEKIVKEVAETREGTVIADFFLPYLCCSEYAPPSEPPDLRVHLHCTDAVKNTALAELTPEGGTGPYFYQLDNNQYEELEGPIELNPGSHRLRVCDSLGAESAVQPVTVPQALAILTDKYPYTEDPENMQYKVSLKIVGGTPPYTANRETVSGDTYTSPPVHSGEQIEVTITDSVKCETKRAFQHTVTAPPCTLPCDGNARRCGHPFWIFQPEPDYRYGSYEVEVKKFEFEFPEKGQTIDLAREVSSIVRAGSEDLNSNFNGMVTELMDEINALIAKVTRRNDWLRLEYESEPNNYAGTLWVEFFECLDFEFHIHSTFTRNDTESSLDMIYSQTESQMNGKWTVPSYNCVGFNRCHSNRPEIDLCGEVDLNARIKREVIDDEGKKQLRLSFEMTPRDEAVQRLWVVQDGVPQFSMEREDTFTFSRPMPKKKKIWLTAFTERGCRALETIEIDLGDLG